jgi:hypothetical protein
MEFSYTKEFHLIGYNAYSLCIFPILALEQDT